MPVFSANLGFLWNNLPLPDAVRAAKKAGFAAIECHWPYDTPPQELIAVLQETKLKLLGINTRRGNSEAGENGLSAVPGREAEARGYIDEALAYAAEVGASCVHVMAGNANGEQAHKTFVDNLRYACEQAQPHGITILLEPLNRHDAPDYFLRTTDQAVAIIDELPADNLKLMFDVYHVQQMEGDICRRLTSLLSSIGHIQFASVPGRGTPDHGEINFSHVFEHIDKLGYQQPLGAEYKPEGETDHTLQWLNQFSTS